MRGKKKEFDRYSHSLIHNVRYIVGDDVKAETFE